MKILKITLLSITFIVILAFIICTAIVIKNIVDVVNILSGDALTEKQIVQIIDENYETLLYDIAENDFADSKNIKGIQEITRVGDAFDFYCGGKGFGSGTSYFGFYFTPDDAPRSVWSGQKYSDVKKLVKKGDGFCIKEEDGDNYYYTERIRKYFYRYEVYF